MAKVGTLLSELCPCCQVAPKYEKTNFIQSINILDNHRPIHSERGDNNSTKAIQKRYKYDMTVFSMATKTFAQILFQSDSVWSG